MRQLSGLAAELQPAALKFSGETQGGESKNFQKTTFYERPIEVNIHARLKDNF